MFLIFCLFVNARSCFSLPSFVSPIGVFFTLCCFLRVRDIQRCSNLFDWLALSFTDEDFEMERGSG